MTTRSTLTRTALAVALPTLLVVGACAQPGQEAEPVEAEQQAEQQAEREDLQRFYDQELEFGPCDGYATTTADEQSFSSNPAFQCARAEVPLDYDDPGGRTAQIAMLKAPARGESTGSLVMNPGGPGGPGMSMAALGATTLADSRVTEKFDLIGVDPRGVGASTPAVHCFTGPEADAGQATTTVLVSSKSWSEDGTRGLVNQCADRSGGDDVLKSVSTRNAARDMDIVRAALGDDKLSYFGQSYGTRLGAVYAEMFPDKVRAMVLDGAIDPQRGTYERRITQYAGFQRSFDAMAAFCASRPDCPLGPDPSAATEVFSNTVRPLVDRPIVTADGRPVDFDAALNGVIAGLYDSAAWPAILKGIGELQNGQAQTLQILGDSVAGRQADGTYPNFGDALYAINCMDEQRNTPDQEVDLKREIQGVAPFLDAGLGPDGARDPCESWPAEPTLGYPYATDVQGLPDTLTVSTTGDPSTPYDGGVSLADTLGGSLLTVDGEQHTVAFSGASDCVDDVVADYLVDLQSPPEGTRCSV
nr:alpha/beta hydrolase [Rhodococcus sp. (in: high G+C Gram-positive bacteria)]